MGNDNLPLEDRYFALDEEHEPVEVSEAAWADFVASPHAPRSVHGQGYERRGDAPEALQGRLKCRGCKRRPDNFHAVSNAPIFTPPHFPRDEADGSGSKARGLLGSFRRPCQALSMPRGSSHTETGLLLYEGRTLTLQLDEGGRWRLDASAKVYRLAGLRVKLTGVREEFDLLHVTRVEHI